MRKAALHNLGCKVNAYETEAMQQMLEKEGYEIVPFQEKADVYIINTCTVTNIADRKSRQMLHRAKKLNPQAVVVAVGCYVQASKEELEADTCVDLMIGNNKKKDLIPILLEYTGKAAESEVIDINHTTEYEDLMLQHSLEHTRAYIKVQDGCNQFCSYCIIPYTRGRVRSRKWQEIEKEVAGLALKGYQEVVLTGIHLSSYGIDLVSEDFLSLIKKVYQIKGIERIRLGSLEPRIITEDFVKTIAALPKMCPHFHLSLQSGSNTTLQRMNRRYCAEEFYEKVTLLRNYYENPAITTDIIVGFPGETEKEFQETKEFLGKVGFYEMHIFKYSKRQGTKAAEMKEQVSNPIKQERSNELLALTKEQSKKYRQQFIGQTVEVLMEEEVKAEDFKGYQVGHTKEYVKVAVLHSNRLENKRILCMITGFLSDEILHGEIK